MMLDGQETELEIIDHPASEMSVSKTQSFSGFFFIAKRAEMSGGSVGAMHRGVNYSANCVK